jgi:hypothetical protein
MFILRAAPQDGKDVREDEKEKCGTRIFTNGDESSRIRSKK